MIQTRARRSTHLVLAALAAILAASSLASASHWCGQTTIALGPASATAGRETTFTAHVTNNGIDTTSLESVEYKFSWEGVWRNVSSGMMLAGQSLDFTARATPPSAGSYAVEVRLNGTSSGDILRETSSCTASANVTATQPGLPALGAPLALVAVAGAAAAVGLWRRAGRMPPEE